MALSYLTAGVATTALQTVGAKVEMDEAIVILPTWDVPLQTRLGSSPAHEVRVDWLEDALTSSQVTWTATSGALPATLTVADTSNLRIGDVLRDEAQPTAVNMVITTITANTSIVVTDTFSTGIAQPAA